MTSELKYQYFGRKKIYTDVDVITKDNIVSVVQKAMPDYLKNYDMIDFLLSYEGGFQPLRREKTIRKDIDVKDIMNLAHYITDFKLAYNWGNPISFVKKNGKSEKGQSIQNINDMLDLEGWNSKNQKLFRFVEIAGLGYTYLNTKKRISNDEPPVDYAVVDPRFAFKVYRNNINETPILDVMIRVLKDGSRWFSCYTADSFYLLKNFSPKKKGNKDIPEWIVDENATFKNALGMLPLVEWNRDSDRMGCFEREINAMDALNIKNSDFSNDVCQKVQAIIHANDVEFPLDEDGELLTPQSNDWVTTKTTASGKTPFIKAIESTFDYTGVEKKILEDANGICSRCFVPLKQEMGGGSTGTAMSLSSGWAEAEAYANKQEMVIKESLMQVMRLVLRILELTEYDKKIGKIDLREIEPHILRNKTYDLATKSNAVATLLSHGFSLKDALVISDLSGDVATVIRNSQKTVDLYQAKELATKQNNEKTGLQDNSMQTENSPIVDGMKTEKQPEGEDNRYK